MAGIPDVTLLIQDLLSPPIALSAQTPALISYHLSLVPLNTTLLPTLIRCVATSPSLWNGQAEKNDTEWDLLNFERSKEIYDSIRNGVLYRGGEITRELGTGWRARRRMTQFLDLLYEGLMQVELHPTILVLLCSAILSALQFVKSRKEKLYVGGSTLLGRAEVEVLQSWKEYFEVESGTRVDERIGNNGASIDSIEPVLPTWLAAQVLPAVSAESLKSGPLTELLFLLNASFVSTFSFGNIFENLGSDLSSTVDGVHWNIPSPSHTTLSTLIDSMLFQTLGPISKAIGRCVEAAGIAKTPESIQAVVDIVESCESMSKKIQKSWSGNTWCNLEESQLDITTRKITIPWTILKTLLFSLTLVQSSLLILVTPLNSGTATPLQLQLASQALRTLSHTYFITIKFGTEGFGAWRGLFSGLLEVVGHEEEIVTQLLIAIQPLTLGKQIVKREADADQVEDILHEPTVERSRVTFYLNASEQLMKIIPSAYVEKTILFCCHPYLEDPKYRDTFESAHSVLLSIFASGKECANELTPYYTRLLLSAYPDLMSAAQLRLAFTTMIRCVSNSDDALAWQSILLLIESIRALPVSLPTQVTLPTLIESENNLNSGREFDEEITTLSEATILSPTEEAALTLQRGHLLLALIDQTTSVNLILLQSLLEKIWEFIREESGDGREALVKVVFSTLGEGLDATKREAGVVFWMERAEELA